MPVHIQRNAVDVTYCGIMIGSEAWGPEESCVSETIVEMPTCAACREAFLASRLWEVSGSNSPPESTISWPSLMADHERILDLQALVEELQKLVLKQREQISILSAATYIQGQTLFSDGIPDNEIQILKGHLEANRPMFPVLVFESGQWMFRVQGYGPPPTGGTVWDKIGSEE